MVKEKTFLYVIIALVVLLLCTTVSTGFYKNKYDKLVSEHRQQLELIRSRTEQYENTYKQARETNRELGECLSKSATTLSGLRQQISEVRERYEKMENLLNSSWDNDSDIYSDNSCIDSSDGEQ